MSELNQTPKYFLRILARSYPRLELRAHVTLHWWLVDQGPLPGSTTYCCPLDSFSTWQQWIVLAQVKSQVQLPKCSLLLLTFIRGYKRLTIFAGFTETVYWTKKCKTIVIFGAFSGALCHHNYNIITHLPGHTVTSADFPKVT